MREWILRNVSDMNIAADSVPSSVKGSRWSWAQPTQEVLIAVAATLHEWLLVCRIRSSCVTMTVVVNDY